MNVQQPSASATQNPRLRLEFLDGLRGLMALYVVLFHASYFTQETPLQPVAQFLISWLNYGHYAVDVFIVLSGFCLMMPVARSKDGIFPYSFRTYISRRARRMLPPYYAALFFSIILVGLGQFLQRSNNVGGTYVNDIFSPGIILSHLFLVHNLDFTWAHRINTPMWSVATEWQIYFFFPLLLLPLLKRVGRIPTVIIALLIGLLPWFLLPSDANFYWASPWFLGLFAMGMVGAEIVFGKKAELNRWQQMLAQWPTAVVVYALGVLPILPNQTPIWVFDILVGLGTTSLIMFCTRIVAQRNQQSKTSIIVRILESPWLVGLGTFSYSLYLVHSPLQQAAMRVLQSHLSSPELILGIQIVLVMPVIIGMAYLFHLVFERRFMNMPPVKRSQAQLNQTSESTIAVSAALTKE
jgi:peptidoglycan/LPS O-acetylase OafA/YrhL